MAWQSVSKGSGELEKGISGEEYFDRLLRFEDIGNMMIGNPPIRSVGQY